MQIICALTKRSLLYKEKNQGEITCDVDDDVQKLHANMTKPKNKKKKIEIWTKNQEEDDDEEENKEIISNLFANDIFSYPTSSSMLEMENEMKKKVTKLKKI